MVRLDAEQPQQLVRGMPGDHRRDADGRQCAAEGGLGSAHQADALRCDRAGVLRGAWTDDGPRARGPLVPHPPAFGRAVPRERELHAGRGPDQADQGQAGRQPRPGEVHPRGPDLRRHHRADRALGNLPAHARGHRGADAVAELPDGEDPRHLPPRAGVRRDGRLRDIPTRTQGQGILREPRSRRARGGARDLPLPLVEREGGRDGLPEPADLHQRQPAGQPRRAALPPGRVCGRRREECADGQPANRLRQRDDAGARSLRIYAGHARLRRGRQRDG